VNIDKNQILEFLRGQDKHQEADQAAQELPDQVDTDRDAGMLSKFGIDIPALLAKFGLGDKLGGIADKLPGGLGKLL
jgi:hypothetical protein